MEATPPIITDEHGDVTIFSSLDAAEEYLEAVDILNDEYRIYDSTGLALEGEVVVDRSEVSWVHRLIRPPRERVRLVVLAESERRPDQLAGLLRSFLAAVGAQRTGIDPERLASLTLDELVAAASSFPQR